MSDKNLANEVKRLNAIIRAVERQRDEALTARAHSDATCSLLQEVVKEVQGTVAATKQELADVKAKLLELQKGEDAETTKKAA